MKNRMLLVVACAATLAGGRIGRAAEDTVKVGVLHSPGGATAVSEASLQNVLLFAFDEINAQGGVLGKRIEPVMVDPASNGPLFAEKTGQRPAPDGVVVVFGCWGATSHKSALPVFEKFNGTLFYPVQYEGEELSKSIFYTAVAARQQAIPVVDRMLGAGRKQFYLLGSDSVYPRTANKLLKQYLKRKGIPDSDIVERYVPAGPVDYPALVAEVRKFSANGRACVISTLNVDANTTSCAGEFACAGLLPESCPVVCLGLSEDGFRSLPARNLVGHFGGWTYSLSQDTPENQAFAGNFKKWLETAPANADRKGRDAGSAMELSRAGVYLWKQAVEKAGSFDVDKVRAAMIGLQGSAPEGNVTVPASARPASPTLVGAAPVKGQLKLIKPLDTVAGL